MEGLNLFDIISLAVVVFSVLLSFNRGIVRETMSVLGWVFSAVAAFLLAPLFNPYLAKIGYIGPLLETSCELSTILSFTVCFAASLMIWSLLTTYVTSMMQLPVLSAFDRSLGIIFGGLRGLVLISLALIVNQTVIPAGGFYDSISGSKSAEVFAGLSETMLDHMPDGPPDWLLNFYGNLMSTCDGQLITTPEVIDELDTDALTDEPLDELDSEPFDELDSDEEFTFNDHVNGKSMDRSVA